MTNGKERDAPFKLPRLILCEGPDDAAFFHQLIEVRGLPRCHIKYTCSETDPHGGNTKFDRALIAQKFNHGFDKLRHILIVSDNDTEPAKNFDSICNQVAKAGFPRPTAELTPTELTPTAGKPAVIVMMIPLGAREGNLECICAHAARRRWPRITPIVDDFQNALPLSKWRAGSVGKLWLRSCLAATCERDPFVDLRSALVAKKFKKLNLIPLNDGSFKGIVKVLEHLA